MKNYLCMILLAGTLLFSCDPRNGSSEPIAPANNKFPGPKSVTVSHSTNSYAVRWDSVANAVDYLLYARVEQSKQVTAMGKVTFPGSLDLYVPKTDVRGSPPYRLGIVAVSYDGMYSDITWSDEFNKTE